MEKLKKVLIVQSFIIVLLLLFVIYLIVSYKLNTVPNTEVMIRGSTIP